MKRFIPFFITILSLGLSHLTIAQDVIPKITPEFFAPDDQITVEYDVTGTTLASLASGYLWAWLPEKENFNAPTNINPASGNTAETNAVKFEKIQNEGKTIFKIVVTPTQLFGKPANDIQKIGVILKGNDWSDGQTSDFTFEVTGGFSLKITSPVESFAFYDPEHVINLRAITSSSATIRLSIDGETVKEVQSTSLTFDHTVINDSQLHMLEVFAKSEDDSATVTHSYRLKPVTVEASLPEGLEDGINYHANDPAKVTLVLRAPNKDNVYVLGDFNDWEINPDYLMKKDGDQFWIEINGLISGREYIFQYLVDGNIRIADPYTEKVSSQFDDAAIVGSDIYPNLKPYPTGKTTEEAGYLQTNRPAYDWEVKTFDRPESEDLIIYEMLIRDFTETRTYEAAIERFDYLDSLGINAIELMPVMEFEGNNSWGYNPAFMTATDKYYGTREDFKKFVDEAHKRGIAIILDIALNHSFGRSPLVRLYNIGGFGAPRADNPWLNPRAKHDFNVGYDFNHESQLTQYYVDRVVKYWIEEYNIDGYRFDLSKGFTQKNTLGNLSEWNKLDPSRVRLLNRMVDGIKAIDSTAYIILEHLSDNEEERVLANDGMMLWGKMTDKYNELAKGTNTSIARLYHEWRGYDEPHVVGYMESHDEERNMFSLEQNRGSLSLEQRIDRMKLNTAFFLTVPGPKMIWQFGEMGYDEELNDNRLGIKPTHWEYLEVESRAKLKDVYQSLINLRTKTDFFKPENFSWEPGNVIKWINAGNEEVKISIVGNFSNIRTKGNPHFASTGILYDYFSGEQITVDDPEAEISLAPGEFHIYTSKVIENYIEGDPSPQLVTSLLNNGSQVRIYPIPAKDKIWIQSDHATHTIYEIYTTAGVLVSSGEVEERRNVNIESLVQGIYVLRLSDREHNSTIRFIKQ